jgi:hypothetical protein
MSELIKMYKGEREITVNTLPGNVEALKGYGWTTTKPEKPKKKPKVVKQAKDNG